MRIGQLRRLVEKYKNKRAKKNALHEEENSLSRNDYLVTCDYLQQFTHEQDSYALTTQQFYQLLVKLSLDNSSKIMNKIDYICNELDDRLFKLFKASHQEKKINPHDFLHSSLEENLSFLIQLHSKELADLVSHLKKSGITLTENTQFNMLLLTNYNVRQLKDIIARLEKHSLFTDTAFQPLLQRVINKPIVEEVAKEDVEKRSRKQTGNARSETLIKGKSSFFWDHSKDYAQGSGGVVKKGYAAMDAMIPIFSVKKATDYENEYQELVHDGQGNIALGRKACLFYSKNPTLYSCDKRLLSLWHAGRPINKYHPDELKNTSIESRLRCIISGWTDLTALQQHNLVHCDIAPQNFILDMKANSMKLIDFGGSREFGANDKTCAFTYEYTDPYTDRDKQNFHRDIYSMGLIIMILFPELYKTIPGRQGTVYVYSIWPPPPRETSYVLIKTELSIHEQAIVRLAESATHHDVHQRCNTEDALKYCQSVLENFSTLDEKLLQNIAAAIINRSNITAEDAFYDSVRPQVAH